MHHINRVCKIAMHVHGDIPIPGQRVSAYLLILRSVLLERTGMLFISNVRHGNTVQLDTTGIIIHKVVRGLVMCVDQMNITTGTLTDVFKDHIVLLVNASIQFHVAVFTQFHRLLATAPQEQFGRVQRISV